MNCRAFLVLVSLLPTTLIFGQPSASTEVVRPPGALELVGLLRDDRALNRAHDVELQGDLAFVPGTCHIRCSLPTAASWR